ncbi:MAG: iron-containing alcohol dehydrogenase family protein [Microbacterium sp.]
MIAQFAARTRILAGPGALSRTAAVFRELGAHRIMVVADEGLARIGALDEILEAAGVRDMVVRTALAGVNPSPADVDRAAAEAREARADAVLAVGGGSGVSAAKAVALLVVHPGDALSLEGEGRAEHPPVPTVAVPTTAGSGSEVSNALVLHDPDRVREVVIRGSGYEPEIAVLDASVLRGLPRDPLVFAALDALTHALEALWSRGRSVFTDACALHAAAEILDALPGAVAGQEDGSNARGENDAGLQRLLEAASLANLACGNSGLALVHALSSSPAVRVPHGRQNGILLPHVAELNRAVLDASGTAIVDRLPELYRAIRFDAVFAPGEADSEAMVAASRGHTFRRNDAGGAEEAQLRALLRDAGAA